MKTRLIASVILLQLLTLCSSTIRAQTLVIWQKDGSKVYYSLDDLPKTMFTFEELVITTTKNIIKYPLSKIQRYTYEDTMQGIGDAKPQSISIVHHGDEIIVIGLPVGKTITVFGVDGKQLASKRSDGATRQSLSLSKLAMGVYVIKAENVNYKLLKR